MLMSASEDGKVRLYDLRAAEETVAVKSRGAILPNFQIYSLP